jgi:hypothetical protein
MCLHMFLGLLHTPYAGATIRAASTRLPKTEQVRWITQPPIRLIVGKLKKLCHTTVRLQVRRKRSTLLLTSPPAIECGRLGIREHHPHPEQR